MSCTAYIVYTFSLSLHNANFGQFKAKQVLSKAAFTTPVIFAVDHIAELVKSQVTHACKETRRRGAN